MRVRGWGSFGGGDPSPLSTKGRGVSAIEEAYRFAELVRPLLPLADK
jgi:hypothetical protein